MSLTTTISNRQNGTDIVRVTLAWTSAADGSASGDTPSLSGELMKVVFDPGSAAPTANYDITLNDANGFDVLAGFGANLSATVTTQLKPGIAFKDGTTTSVAPTVIDGVLTLAVTNAGDTKSGSVVLYLR